MAYACSSLIDLFLFTLGSNDSEILPLRFTVAVDPLRMTTLHDVLVNDALPLYYRYIPNNITQL